MGERPTGSPCWVDVAAPDVAAARACYAGLFGWEAHDGPPEAGGYVMCTLHGRPVAAISPQMGGGPGHPAYWTTYVAVDDADATAARIAAAGGETLAAPFDVLDAGRMGVFRDPAGAVFAIWQKGSHRGFLTDMGEPGAPIWSELSSRDVERAIAFYAEALGWELRPYDRLPAEQVEELGYRVIHTAATGEQGAGGIQPISPGLPDEVPSFWLPYFASDDADRDAARIGELGGSVMVGPFTVETVGRIVLSSDPQGAWFGLLQPSM